MRTIFSFSCFCSLVCSILIFTSCEKESADDDNPDISERFSIDTFDLSDAKYLMIHGNGSQTSPVKSDANTRAWYYEYDNQGNVVHEWTDDPLLVKIDIHGKASPVMTFTLGGREVKWSPKSIKYLNQNYVLFETDYDYTDYGGYVGSHYLVRLSDGKAFEFEFFSLNTGFQNTIEDNYWYGHFSFMVKDMNQPFESGAGRFYLSETGDVTFEALSSYKDIPIDLFTKDYFGSNYNKLITHKSSQQSYMLTNEAIGVDYYCNYFYHRKDDGLIQTFFINNELHSTRFIPIGEYCDNVFAYNGSMYVLYYNSARSKYDLKHYYVNELQEIKNWEGLKESTAGFSKINYITNVPDKIECHFTDYDNNMYVIDFSNVSENKVYTLLDTQQYNNRYKIHQVTYLSSGNKYSVEATKLSTTTKVLLSLDINPDSKLIEEEEYTGKVVTIVPIN